MNIHKAVLASLLAFGIAAPACAQSAGTGTPGVDQREQNQQQRIEQGKRDSAAIAKAKHNKKTNPNPPSGE